MKTTRCSCRGHEPVAALRRAPRGRRAGRSAAPSGVSPWRAIQAAQCSSFPIITSAAQTALRISSCSGLVIAEVIPDAIAIGRKAALRPGPVGQAEADVGGAARGVDAELLAQPAHEPEDLPAGGAHRADRHHERVDDDIVPGDAVVGGAGDDLARHLEAHVGILGDAGLVVRDRDHRRAVPRDQR